MKKLLLAIVLIVGCKETTKPEEETMHCALKYTYYEYSYENWDHPDFDLDNPPLEISKEYYRCVEDASEGLCLYKAEHGCNEWRWWDEGLWDSCASDLTYYGTWASQSCEDFCAEHGGVGGEHLDDEYCSSGFTIV